MNGGRVICTNALHLISIYVVIVEMTSEQWEHVSWAERQPDLGRKACLGPPAYKCRRLLEGFPGPHL